MAEDYTGFIARRSEALQSAALALVGETDESSGNSSGTFAEEILVDDLGGDQVVESTADYSLPMEVLDEHS